MIPEYTKRIAFRLSEKERQQIEKLIREGKYRNISVIIRAALKLFLESEG
jgi:Arc/MetJ-type ribon-helix-helix transcriptional regulator